MIDTAKKLGYQLVTVGDCLGDPPVNWYRDPATGEPKDARRASPPPPPPQRVPTTTTLSSSTSAPTPTRIPQTNFHLDPSPATSPGSGGQNSTASSSLSPTLSVPGSSTTAPGAISTTVPDVGGRRAVPPQNYFLASIFGHGGGNITPGLVLGWLGVWLFWVGV